MTFLEDALIKAGSRALAHGARCAVEIGHQRDRLFAVERPGDGVTTGGHERAQLGGCAGLATSRRAASHGSHQNRQPRDVLLTQAYPTGLPF
jgi:hypothetical protein